MSEGSEDLQQHLGEAREALEEARGAVVQVEALIQQVENESNTLKANGERSLADLDRRVADARTVGDNDEMRRLQEQAAAKSSELTDRLNQLESRLGHLRGERISAVATQTERELEIKELDARIDALSSRADASEAQLRRADQLQARLGELQGKYDELTKQISEYAPVVEAQRDAAVGTGARELAEEYATQGKQHSSDWHSWLWRLLVLGVLALVGGITVILITHPHKNATNAEIVSAVAIDLLVLGLLLYAVRFAAHQFSVHRHLEAVAEAKAAALNTFTRMIAGPTEVEVRSAVSVALAQAVFDCGTTGFIDGSNDNITLVERVFAPVAQKVSS